jgi:protein required for attachment to host cells
VNSLIVTKGVIKLMNKCLVTVINGSKARFLTLEPSDELDLESGYKLVEQNSISNPAKEQQGKELWSNTKTGRNQGSGGQAHAYDDHRQNHLDEYERRFARTTADEIAKFAQTQHIRQLLLVAEPKILGILRETVASLLPNNLHIQELTKDLCKLKPSEIYGYLVSKNLLPYRGKTL